MTAPMSPPNNPVSEDQFGTLGGAAFQTKKELVRTPVASRIMPREASTPTPQQQTPAIIHSTFSPGGFGSPMDVSSPFLIQRLDDSSELSLSLNMTTPFTPALLSLMTPSDLRFVSSSSQSPMPADSQAELLHGHLTKPEEDKENAAATPHLDIDYLLTSNRSASRSAREGETADADLPVEGEEVKGVFGQVSPLNSHWQDQNTSKSASESDLYSQTVAKKLNFSTSSEDLTPAKPQSKSPFLTLLFSGFINKNLFLFILFCLSREKDANSQKEAKRGT